MIFPSWEYLDGIYWNQGVRQTDRPPIITYHHINLLFPMEYLHLGFISLFFLGVLDDCYCLNSLVWLFSCPPCSALPIVTTFSDIRLDPGSISYQILTEFFSTIGSVIWPLLPEIILDLLWEKPLELYIILKYLGLVLLLEICGLWVALNFSMSLVTMIICRGSKKFNNKCQNRILLIIIFLGMNVLDYIDLYILQTGILRQCNTLLSKIPEKVS